MWPIVTKPYMMIALYDICIVDTYHGNRSNVKLEFTETVKTHKCQMDTIILLKQRRIRIVFDILDISESFNVMSQFLTS